MSGVFPTHVGVFPPDVATGHLSACLPHTRGGVSAVVSVAGHSRESSPHTWGCFFVMISSDLGVFVFPTHVGVFPSFRCGIGPMSGLPHTRGGVSIDYVSPEKLAGSSPHTWGCFSSYIVCSRFALVFPTHVGVFPDRRLEKEANQSLPHTRGGVSNADSGGAI